MAKEKVTIPAPLKAPPVSASFPDEPMVKMRVLYHEADGLGKQVEVFVNGKTFIIRRGRIVTVPLPVYLTLQQTGRATIEIVG